MSGNKLIRFLWTTILLVSLCVLAGLIMLMVIEFLARRKTIEE